MCRVRDVGGKAADVHALFPGRAAAAAAAHRRLTTGASAYPGGIYDRRAVVRGLGRRRHYWQLIQALVAQIVLQRDGHDQDAVAIEIDVEAIISAYARAEDVDQVTATLREAQDQVRRLRPEMRGMNARVRMRGPPH